MRPLIPVFFSALIVACTAACGPAVKLGAPPGFAHVAGDYDDRVASPRGVVIAARIEDNDPRANLDFWVEAVDLRVRAQGWAMDGIKEIKTTGGLTGKSMQYTRLLGTTTSRYRASVFVTERRVVLVEAGGDQVDFDAAAEQIDKTIASVSVQ